MSVVEAGIPRPLNPNHWDKLANGSYMIDVPFYRNPVCVRPFGRAGTWPFPTAEMPRGNYYCVQMRGNYGVICTICKLLSGHIIGNKQLPAGINRQSQLKKVHAGTIGISF